MLQPTLLDCDIDKVKQAMQMDVRQRRTQTTGEPEQLEGLQDYEEDEKIPNTIRAIWMCCKLVIAGATLFFLLGSFVIIAWHVTVTYYQIAKQVDNEFTVHEHLWYTVCENHIYQGEAYTIARCPEIQLFRSKSKHAVVIEKMTSSYLHFVPFFSMCTQGDICNWMAMLWLETLRSNMWLFFVCVLAVCCFILYLAYLSRFPLLSMYNNLRLYGIDRTAQLPQ
jgi:hypothetical protein